MNQVPSFAVVGPTSEGKTTLIATLAEDDEPAIGPEPHTTQSMRSYEVTLDDKVVIRFFDTPGFENAGAAMKRLEAIRAAKHCHKSNAVDTFYQEICDNGSLHDDFRYERELLTPLLKHDAAAIVVLDASKGPDDMLEPVMEVLSWSCRPRALVVNYHENEEDRVEEMLRVALEWGGFARKINAAKATPKERFELLADLMLACSPDWDRRPELEYTLQALRQRWAGRIKDVARLIAEALVDCLGYSISGVVAKDVARDAEEKRLRSEFHDHLRDRERALHEKIHNLNKHRRHAFSLTEDVKLDDLFAKPTWRTFGMTRRQLVAIGAGAGALIGGLISIPSGGTVAVVSVPAGAVIGGCAAICARRYAPVRTKAPRVPRLHIVPERVRERLRWARKKGADLFHSLSTSPQDSPSLPQSGQPRDEEATWLLQSVELTIGPHPAVDFPFVLLRRSLAIFYAAIRTAHGDRNAADAGNINREEIIVPAQREEVEERTRLLDLFEKLRNADSTQTKAAEAQLSEEVKRILCRIAGVSDSDPKWFPVEQREA